MPTTFPLVSAGERQPKRAYPLATGAKAAAKALVWGVESDEGRRPASLAEAAIAGSMKVDTLRRWLHRPDMRSLIAEEKKAFLAWATSANAQALTTFASRKAYPYVYHKRNGPVLAFSFITAGRLALRCGSSCG